MQNAHLDALASRHKMIEGQIAAEMRRPLPDPARLSSLKRQKLKVKDEIARNG